MAELRFGIVGAGLIAAVHAAALAELPAAELAAVYNRSRPRGEALAGKYGVPWYDDYRAFLSKSGVDTVIICTPSGTHADYALPAAEAGKHLVIEKPLEITVERSLSILEAAERHRVELAVIFQNRFKDAVRAARRALDEGRIGKPVLGDAQIKWYRPADYYRGWKGTKRYDGGGALMNQGIHTIDLLQWMMGPVEEVYGYVSTRAHRIEVEDLGVATLKFESGALGVIEGSTAIYPGLDERLGIYGTEGSIEISGNKLVTWEFLSTRPSDVQAKETGAGDEAGGSSSPGGIGIENHRRQLAAIVDALLAGGDPPVSGQEAIKSVAIIEAIYKASSTGRPVKPKTV